MKWLFYRPRTVVAVVTVVLPLLFSCSALPLSPIDPENEAKKKLLGPESPAVPVGGLHRPGQPCVVCHNPGGEAEAYSVAGTVYRDIKTMLPLADVEVFLIDARGTTFTAPTNCAGNFYVTPSQFAPVSPLWTSLRFGDDKIDMESPIHREWSCAGCHTDPTGPTSAGHIFLVTDELDAQRIVPRPCRPGEGDRVR